MSEVSLPKGWITVNLGSIVRVSSGVGFPKKYQGQSSGCFPVYKVGDVSKAVTNESGNLATAGHFVNEYEAAELKGEIFPKGTTLFAKIGEAVKLNRRAFVLKPGLADNNVMAVLPDVNESDRFIYHFMRTVDLTDVSRSTTVPSVRKGDIEDIKIALPPLNEQTIIADKLDILLAQVETTKFRLEHIPVILKRFRQSVLSAAVSGRLTEEWRNYNSYDTKHKVLSDIIEHAQVGLVRSSSEQKDSDSEKDYSPYIKMNNINSEWGLSISDVVYVRCDSAERDKYRLKIGDWLFNTRNSSELVGKSCVWNEAGEYLYNNNILRIRLKDNCLSGYLEIWFRSPLGRSSLEKIKSATTSVAAIYQKQLLKQVVLFPSTKEQFEIIRRVEKLFSFADSIEQKVNAALERVNNLTQSILAKAFRGELTVVWRAANSDLIDGVNSAEYLLEKIRSEREVRKPVKGIHTRKKV